MFSKQTLSLIIGVAGGVLLANLISRYVLKA